MDIQKQSTPITKEGLEALGFKEEWCSVFFLSIGDNLIGVSKLTLEVFITPENVDSEDIPVPNCNTIEDLQTLIDLFK